MTDRRVGHWDVLQGEATKARVVRRPDNIRPPNLRTAGQEAAIKSLGFRAPVDVESSRRQREAIVDFWRGEGAAHTQLPQQSMSVLVAKGIGDAKAPAEHSFAIAPRASNAKLILYPDAGHKFPLQCAENFTGEVVRFREP